MKSQSKNNIRRIGDYYISYNVQLGRGGFGSVFEGQHVHTKQKVAIKIVQRPQYKTSIQQQYRIKALNRQILILGKFKCENRVDFKQLYITHTHFYIILEKCDTDLKRYVSKQPNKRVSHQEAIQIMTQILKGCYYMILGNIVHRDLKPQNILMKNGVCKLADFGLARTFKREQVLMSTVGTKKYSAPEMDKQEKFYSNKCDIWSIGCIFYEILYGMEAITDEKRKKQVQKHGINFPIYPTVPKQTLDFIKSCICAEQKRIDWFDIFNHRLFANKIPALKPIDITINKIITTMRRYVGKSNIDLQRFFTLIVKIQSSINLRQYCSTLKKLIPKHQIPEKQIEQSFNYFDKNGDGVIQLNQFLTILENFDVYTPPQKQDKITKQQAIFYLLSYFEDQQISKAQKLKQELKRKQQAYKKLSIKMNEILKKNDNKLMDYFQEIDTKNQGINFNQFYVYIRKHLQNEMTQEQCKLVFNMFDSDNNNKIDFSQFLTFVYQIPPNWNKQ